MKANNYFAHRSRWRLPALSYLTMLTLPLTGCFVSTYPESYDASDFEEFRFRVELPECSQDISTTDDFDCSEARVCEATITRQTTGDYVVLLQIPTVCESDAPADLQRSLTDEEAEWMRSYSQLRINRHPWPDCEIASLSDAANYVAPEYHFQWDDFELIVTDCDHARLSWRRALDIHNFLDGLLPSQ